MEATKPPLALRVLRYEMARVDLISPLKREECSRRLRESLGQSLPMFASRVGGQVGETWFTLGKRGGWPRREMYRPVVRGSLVEESRQTRIQCRFGLRLSRVVMTTIGMAVWLEILVTIARSHSWSTIQAFIYNASIPFPFFGKVELS